MLPFCNHFAILHKNIYYLFRENSKIICNKNSLPHLYPLSPLRQSAYTYIKSGRWCGGFAREQPYPALFCRFFDKNAVGQAYVLCRFLQYFYALFHISAEFTAYMPYSYQILQLDSVRMPYIKIMQNAANLMYFAPILEI